MPTKLIVTHSSPDLDALTSIWLLKRFDEQHFGEAQVEFVNPGEKISLDQLSTLGLQQYEVVHVDTGGEDFDHHTVTSAKERTCAAKLVLLHLLKLHPELEFNQSLDRLVDHVIAIDLFEDAYWPERNEVRDVFRLAEIIPYLKNIGLSDGEIVDYGLVSLDAVYAHLKSIIQAEDEIKEAFRFETHWGQGVALETSNIGFTGFAQKQGYPIVIRRDQEYQHTQIKALPGKKIDLSNIYEKITTQDPKATWFLHPSKTMLLNGSDPRRSQVATKLTLSQIIKLFD